MRSALTLVSLLLALTGRAEDIVRVAGSGALVQPFVLAAPVLKKERQVELRVYADSNTPNAIAGVGADLCEIAVSTRPLLPAERAAFPDRPLPEVTVGHQALVLCVSNDVFQEGVHVLSKADMQKIYEGTITNWKALGGPDRRIKFYNPEQGKGVWEFFVTWLYGDMRKAGPGANFESVGTAEAARDLVEFNGGALGILPIGSVGAKGVNALSLREESGKVIEPTKASVRNATYPLARPVIAVTAFRPTGPLRATLEFLLSKDGQELVQRANMLPAVDDAAAK